MDKRYVSTSWKQEVASRYASVTEIGKERADGVKGIFLDITGRSGADISGISTYPKEAELLYGRNTQFICDSCIPTKVIGQNKFHYLKLREASVQKDVFDNADNIITVKNRLQPQRAGSYSHNKSAFNHAVKRQHPHAEFNSWGILKKPLH